MKNSLQEKIQVVYISPLKALGNDIYKNLEMPLAEITQLFSQEGIIPPKIRSAVRSGDTSQNLRRQMLKQPPHILITTPESLHILLTAEKSREMLSDARTIIVDEIHAMAGDKRGTHLSLSLERLDYLCGKKLQRIGLSATQKPIELVGEILVGNRLKGGDTLCIVDTGSHRKMDISIETGEEALGAITTHEYWDSLYKQFLHSIEAHRSTIIFTHTRRLVERISHQLSEKLGKDKVAAHHGSLSKESRFKAENALKSGDIRVIVASASLELGIDVGEVDLVIHVGAPRSLTSLIQRIGRSGHWKGAIPKGIIFPLTRDELMLSAAAVLAIKQGELDTLVVQEKPLDILAQIIVSEASCAEIGIQTLWEMVKGSFYYRNLCRKEFDEIIHMLSEGIATSKGRRSAYLHLDRVNQIVRGRRGAKLAAITSGGSIPEMADYEVIEEPSEMHVGKVHEDFAIESQAGDIFLLGNKSWRIRRLESNKVRVVDAQAAPPTIPFWLGDAPARTFELSYSLSELMKRIKTSLTSEQDTQQEELLSWLQEQAHVNKYGAEQMLSYVKEGMQVLGDIPTMDTIIAERFFDEAGGMQLIIHSPYGARINRAWGLAMRKRFCLTFDFELQSAATDNALLFSLGEAHSFPLESIFGFVRAHSLKEDIIHAMLPLPLFMNRFRWNAGRALAVLRFMGGRRVPIQFQRMRTEDLLSSVFPAYVGCQDNRSAPIEPVDHPLVDETIKNCLHEAMDIDHFHQIIRKIDSGEIKTIAVDTPIPSVFSHEILNANPYAFLDDAPLEERRARAVSLRRVSPDIEAGKLSPEAIDEVIRQAWPDVRDHHELHDMLLSIYLLPVEMIRSDDIQYDWSSCSAELMASRRAFQAHWKDETGHKRSAYVPTELIEALRKILPQVEPDPSFTEFFKNEYEPLQKNTSREEHLVRLIGGWMEIKGPITITALSQELGIRRNDVAYGMASLEAKGLVLQGRFLGN